MATFDKRPNGKWRAQVRRKGLPSVSKNFVSKRAAEAWARETEAGIETGAYNQKPKPTETIPNSRLVTLGQLLERYRDDVSAQKKGKKEETARINAILRHNISKNNAYEVKSSDWAKYKDERLKRLKPQSLRREFNIYKKMYKLARIEWGFTDLDNPLADIHLSPKSRKRDRRLSQEEWDRVLTEARRRRNPLIALIIEWQKESGMRRSETLNMLWQDVNLRGRLVMIPETKTDEGRQIPITRAMGAILGALRRDSERVFPIAKDNLESTVDRVIEAVGLKGKFSLHLWRHERVSSLFEAGLSIPEVASVSGHKDWKMLAHYTHIRPAQILKKIEG